MQGYAVRMVPLDTDGLENADEYVMQLVVSIISLSMICF